MCIIIDTNAFGCVFDDKNEKHYHFKPVHKWLESPNGRATYGGDKYKNELRKAPKYLNFFSELKKAGKFVEIDDEQVNIIEAQIKEQLIHRDFDDPHLIAIVIVSKCRIICTNDKRAIPYLTNQNLYPIPIKPAKIYQNRKHRRLLYNRNLCHI